jgi:hypothetical protein
MVRFSAEEREIAALVRFLARRAPGGLWMLPLEASHRDELRFRRTPRPFLTRLAREDGPLSWGLLPFPDAPNGAGTTPPKRVAVDRTEQAEATARLRVDPDESGLIVLALGPPQGPERRRDGVLATRDPLPVRVSPVPAALVSENGDAGDGSAPDLRADLVEKCARRLRRRAVRREGDGRWHVSG